ncbi:flagellar protein FliT [Halobacillus shinanisalinarum]|uniref:Flagellar protein FliT n=1 Tax=Halobacillus shinanisalinarum TaxID=2932258 RepID=A0ABY4H5Z2_9BACI|nr:flagellar protein FliT [Halobacillus shinanisalinarum]UOQ95616.1 flagellar protein FliT [Halobacillus shinanisalinarum]
MWEQFALVTAQLDETVHQKVTDQNRKDVLEEVEKLLDQREQFLTKLPQPQTSEEQAVIERIIKREPTLNQKLEFLLNDLKVDLRNMKKQKSSKQRYTNPYQSVSAYDGMFMDHKK